MKKYGSLLLAGILPLVWVVLFMKFVSLHLSYAILLGVLSLFAAASWQSKNETKLLVKTLIMALPLSLAYYFLVVSELPGLWIGLPLFLLAVVLGLVFQKRNPRIWSGLGMTLVASLVAFTLVPQAIAANLGKTLHSPAPDFSLSNLSSGGELNTSTTKGKVVLLDFFGTWCAPCIAEMKELKKVKEQLAAYESDVLFVIACTDKGRDTPEAAKKFHADRQLPFLLAFDHGSSAHQDFGFSGVPALVILDKKGDIRFKHEGFNQAENLPGLLVPIMEELLRE